MYSSKPFLNDITKVGAKLPNLPVSVKTAYSIYILIKNLICFGNNNVGQTHHCLTKNRKPWKNNLGEYCKRLQKAKPKSH